MVHDWLTGMRGGEKVLEVLCELYPQAELFTLVHEPGRVLPLIERRRLHYSLVQWLPFARRFYRQYLPLFPFAIEHFDLDRFDLVISTSHCAAKSVVRPGRTRHLCYCFTPMRYAWDQFTEYFGPEQIGRLPSLALRPALAALARWDADTAGRVDRFLASSHHVARRIRRYYNREALVVYPPVDTAFFLPDGTGPGAYFLIVSALVPYKRIDVAIEACRLIGAPLQIVGNGPELPKLKRMAGPTVEFLGTRSTDELRAIYRRAIAVLLPGEEDFGIAPVEAQACGRPVVGLARGGATESIVDGVSGVLVEENSVEAFAEGLRRVRRERFDPATIRRQALRFSRQRFVAEIRDQVHDLMDAPQHDVRW